MNGHCRTCKIESECGYEYKPTDCCDYRKFKPKSVAASVVEPLVSGQNQELQNCLNKLNEIRNELNQVRDSATIKKLNHKDEPLSEATIEADTCIELTNYFERVLSR